MYRITDDGVRLHDSIRQNGGPATARRVLVVGHMNVQGETFFVLDATNARQFKAILDEFLHIPDVDQVLGGGATWTDGDTKARADTRTSEQVRAERNLQNTRTKPNLIEKKTIEEKIALDFDKFNIRGNR